MARMAVLVWNAKIGGQRDRKPCLWSINEPINLVSLCRRQRRGQGKQALVQQDRDTELLPPLIKHGGGQRRETGRIDKCSLCKHLREGFVGIIWHSLVITMYSLVM